MKIYLAAAWARRDEMKKVAVDLERTIPNLIVNSRWLKEEPHVPYTKAFRRQRAQEDVQDVRRADVLVRFTDDLSGSTVPSRLATGARMFEMGLAYERKIPIIVVGGIQPIFDHLPEVRHVKSIVSLKRLLRKFQKEGC